MKCFDKVQLSDSKIRGVVVGYLDGKLVFNKENTIVNDGRKYIHECFLQKLLKENDALLNNLQFTFFGSDFQYKLGGIKLGTGLRSSSSSMTAADFQPLTDTDEKGNFRYQLNYTSVSNATTIDLENKKITFQCHFDGAESKFVQATELGIFLSSVTPTGADDITRPEYLFSRLGFDPVPIGPGSAFDLEYSIYF